MLMHPDVNIVINIGRIQARIVCSVIARAELLRVIRSNELFIALLAYCAYCLLARWQLVQYSWSLCD